MDIKLGSRMKEVLSILESHNHIRLPDLFIKMKYQKHQKSNFYQILVRLKKLNLVEQDDEKVLSLTGSEKIESRVDIYETDNTFDKNALSETEQKLLDYLLDKARTEIISKLDVDQKELLNNIVMTIQNHPEQRLEIYKNYLLSQSTSKYNNTEDGAVKTFLHITPDESNRVENDIHAMLVSNKKESYQNFLKTYNLLPSENNIKEMKIYLEVSDTEAIDYLDELRITE